MERKTNLSTTLTQEEIEMLYSSGAFGCNSPQAFINTVHPGTTTIYILNYETGKNKAIYSQTTRSVPI